MKVHPIISILSGIIATIVIFGIFTLAFKISILTILVGITTALIIGGFIATYFTKEKKKIYSAYVGAVIAAVVIVSYGMSLEYSVVVYNLLLFVVISLITSIGGYIGENYFKKSKLET